MYNKSYRANRNDAIGLTELVLTDPRSERKQIIALKYAFADAYEQAKKNPDGHLDWDSISKLTFENKIEIDKNVYATPNAFTVDEEAWDYLVEDIKSVLGIQKVRISFLVRLIILFERKKLRDEGKFIETYLETVAEEIIDTGAEDDEANNEILPQVIVNLIEGLEKLGWKSEDITEFMLYVCSGEEKHIETIMNRHIEKEDD